MNTSARFPSQPYGTLPTLDHAVELAGPDALRLSGLSEELGPEHQLVLSPEASAVIWATRQKDGTWVAQELPAETALLHLPAACGASASAEYRRLLRCTFPTQADSANVRIDHELRQLNAKIAHLSILKDELEA